MTFHLHLFHLLLTAGGLTFFLLCEATPLTTPETHLTPPTFPIIPSVRSPASPEWALWLEQPQREKAVEGEDVVFVCRLREPKEDGVVVKVEMKVEMEVRGVEWYLQSGEERRLVLKGNKSANGRAFLSGDLTEDDLSMTLKNVTVEDRGVYVCVFTLPNSVVLHGGGTKLSVREDLGLEQESVGTVIGITLAAVGIVTVMVALMLIQFKNKLKCLRS